MPSGITLRLVGDANDYLGKGLSGGRLDRAPAADVAVRRRGAGHRRQRHRLRRHGAARSSCAASSASASASATRAPLAVVEGVGDHGCEYMTGGRVVVLGATGRNFGAGMSGGIAYVLRPRRRLPTARSTTRWSRSSSSTTTTGRSCTTIVERHRELHRLGRRRAAAGVVERRRSSRFRKVMPTDYKRVLTVMRQAEAEGLDEDADDRQRVMESSARMGEATGFLKWERELPPYGGRCRCGCATGRRSTRTSREDKLQTQAGRCMDCGIPFCNNGCPLGNLIPDWNDLVYRDHWRDAIDRLHATNNFPEFTGRLCPAPCESACVLGINADPVTIKQVEVEIIDQAWDEGWVTPQVPSVKTGKRVAVIGSGPAGLAAAQQLTRAGHDVRRARAGRPHRRAAALRHPRVQDGEAPHRSAARADGGRGHRVPHQRRRRRERRHRRAAGVRTTRSCWPAAPRRGATCRCRAASCSGIHQAMEYLPLRQPRAAGRHRRSRRSRPTASTSSSSAAATPAPTASARRTARARRR